MFQFSLSPDHRVLRSPHSGHSSIEKGPGQKAEKPGRENEVAFIPFLLGRVYLWERAA